MYILTREILDYLVENDFPVNTFLMVVFNGNLRQLNDHIVKMVSSGLSNEVIKESFVSALVAYEITGQLPLTKTFKLNLKQLESKAVENETYNLLVSPLSSFIG